MLDNYVKYLNFLNSKLDVFFNSQKPYIFCKKGCAKCCKHAEFPYSLIEIKYLLTGFLRLDKEKQDIVEQNLQEIAREKKIFDAKEEKKKKKKKFKYDCPFLIDNECCVYEYRGVLCRTFGLLTNTENGIKAPFCCDDGMNYSNVMNLKKSTISSRKFKKLGIKEEPLGFNISYKYLTDTYFEQNFDFKFGEKKSLIMWFLDDV